VKVVIQWKDPDRVVCSVDGGQEHRAAKTGNGYHLPEDVQEALADIGEGEYLMVEFDTETKTAKVLR
jgi:hypothetical protein